MSLHLMAGKKSKILLVAFTVVVAEHLGILGFEFSYPEERSDLQNYQDTSKCYPDVGDWICIYRNYYSDPNYGGSSKCVRYQRYGTYENFTTPAAFTFENNGSTPGTMVLSSSPCYTAKNMHKFTPDDKNSPLEDLYFIYVDCSSCVVIRHRYAANGHGCSLWRRAEALQYPGDCCEFIYQENCGSSPLYQIYIPQRCNFLEERHAAPST